ncbi:hypothetical protein [Streptomyces chrestomyceticus]|uniref:hypothetical protein n=1 Tax=Streptomyces chrestomyceticus TaxID=68185 RepID=UPI001FD5F5B6|nr:hypothetical protein [Streptomyces chrestomyceticus]
MAVTTAPDIGPHIEAVRAALAGAGLAVGLGGAPSPVPAGGRYAVLYPDPGTVGRESLADRRTDLAILFQVTCVGPTAVQCLWVAQQVRRALHPPLAVPGRSTWRPEELGGPPVARDDDVSPPLYFLPVQYRLQSTA